MFRKGLSSERQKDRHHVMLDEWSLKLEQPSRRQKYGIRADQTIDAVGVSLEQLDLLVAKLVSILVGSFAISQRRNLLATFACSYKKSVIAEIKSTPVSPCTKRN